MKSITNTKKARNSFKYGLDKGDKFILSYDTSDVLCSLIFMEAKGGTNGWSGYLTQAYMMNHPGISAEQVGLDALIEFYIDFLNISEAEALRMIQSSDVYEPFRQAGYLIEYYRDNFYLIQSKESIIKRQTYHELESKLCELGYGAKMWEAGGNYRIYFDFATVSNWIEFTNGECLTKGTTLYKQLRESKVYLDLSGTKLFVVQGVDCFKDTIIEGMKQALDDAEWMQCKG